MTRLVVRWGLSPESQHDDEPTWGHQRKSVVPCTKGKHHVFARQLLLGSCRFDSTILSTQISQRAISRRAQVVTASFKVRPYTVRKGDTLGTIARKRGMCKLAFHLILSRTCNTTGQPVIAEIKFEELVALNHDINPDSLVEGQTILLPGGKLSARDREILAGIGPATYRTYPVREGETIQDVIEKRDITRAEMEALNPGVDLDKLASKCGC